MFDYDPETAAFLASTPDARVDLAVWIVSRNRATGADETLGLWTGTSAVALSIGGSPRSYLGAGNVLDAEEIVYRSGQEVQRWRVTFSGATPEVRQAWQTYEIRGAPVEAHQVIRHPRTLALIGTPRLLFEGAVEAIDPSRGAVGEARTVEVVVANGQRAMGTALTVVKSDAAQQKRIVPGIGPDRGRRYAGQTGIKPPIWGA